MIYRIIIHIFYYDQYSPDEIIVNIFHDEFSPQLSDSLLITSDRDQSLLEYVKLFVSCMVIIK